MNAFLSALLTASLSGTAAALVLIAGKKQLVARFGGTWYYYIWLPVLVLFLCGVRPEIPALSQMKAELTAPQQAAQLSMPTSTAEPAGEANADTTTAFAANPYAIAETATVPLPDIGALLLLIYLIGVAVSLLVTAAGYVRFLRRTLDREPVFVRGGMEVYLTSRVVSPVLTGFFKQKLILPDIDMTEDELELILRHEGVHRRRRDIWYKAAVALVRALHWFNPAAYWMERTIGEACEYACDEAVTKAMAPAEKLRYSQMILHVASCRTPALALGFSDSAKQLKRRFLHMNTPRKAGKTILASLLAAVMLVSVFCLSTFVLAWNTTGVEEPNVEVDELIEDKVSVLLVGSDGGGYNTDTLMLVMMDCKTHTINILSIPRDTRVPNPYGGSGYAKINSVYAASGMDGLIRQVGEVTGLPVNFYVKVDFAGFREAIDVLGGVDFDVPMRLKYDDPAQDLHIDLQPGMQHLNGAQAEMLVRSRNQYPMADITRTEVQRDFLKAVITQHATAANLLKINDLYSILTQYVTTNITLGDALKYGPQITKVSSESIQSYILPGTTDSYGNWLYDAEEMERLANEVFWYNVTVRPTPRPSKTPSRIDVYTY